MADRYDRTIKVSQGTIDEIKKMGMTEAIKRAQSGQGSQEFLEGAKRMYGGNKVGYDKTKEAMEPGVQGPHSPGQPAQRKAGPPAPTKVQTQNISSTKPVAGPPAPTQAAIERRIKGTETPEGKAINRAEYKSRLEAANKQTGRNKSIMLSRLHEQAEKDTKVRSNRPKEIEKLEKDLASLKSQNEKASGRSKAVISSRIADKQKSLDDKKKKLQYSN